MGTNIAESISFPAIFAQERILGTSLSLNDLARIFVTKSYCDVNVHFALNEQACLSRKRKLITHEDFTWLPPLQSSCSAISYVSSYMEGKKNISRTQNVLIFFVLEPFSATNPRAK